MNLHFSYKAAKSPSVEKEIQQHVQKLTRRLKVFRPDLVHLHGTLECGAGPKNNCTVTLNLRLPTGQLSAQDDGTNAQAAVKKAFAELIRQLGKHKELLRSEHKWQREKSEMAQPEPAEAETVRAKTPRKANGRADVSAEKETPRRANGKARDEEITAATFAGERNPLRAEVQNYLGKNLGRLKRYVGRELRLREADGQFEPGAALRDEVIDEVVVSALSAESRPGKMSLERWLFRLTLQAIKRVAGGNEDGQAADNVPLERAVGVQNVTGSDEAFLQFHQPGETMNGGDVIADVRAGNPEERAASDETIDQLESSLAGTTPGQRESFVLFAIEGFTVSEIAEIAERSEAAVRADILSARDHLMKKLPPSNALKRKLLQYSSVA